MYIFIDTETTGVNPARDHIVQLAWIIADANGRVMLEKEFIVRPGNFFIPASAVAIHGITTERAIREGAAIEEVLFQLAEDSKDVQCVVAHNVSFDLAVLRREFSDAGFEDPFYAMTSFCTMRALAHSRCFPKLNGRPGHKWPRLDELHFDLFGEYFDDTHDAMADAQACMRCFFELIERGELDVLSKPTIRSRADKVASANSPLVPGHALVPYFSSNAQPRTPAKITTVVKLRSSQGPTITYPMHGNISYVCEYCHHASDVPAAKVVRCSYCGRTAIL